MKRISVVLAAVALVAAACTSGSDDIAPPLATGSTAGGDLRHVVVDTDLASEDIFALLYLMQRDDVAIEAVTITGTGEAHCDPGVRDALGLLALGERTDVPVACGRETPLQGSNAFPQEWRAAADDLSMVDLPDAAGEPDPRSAPELLIDTLDGDATLITLGPLTNVAEALRTNPGLADRVPEMISMAGAIDVGGNTPAGVAEHNVWVDPVAAKEVIERMNVTLVPLDATNDVPYTTFFVQTLEANLDTPEAEAVAAIIQSNEPIFADSPRSGTRSPPRWCSGPSSRPGSGEGARHRFPGRGRGVAGSLGRRGSRPVRHVGAGPARVRTRVPVGPDRPDDQQGPPRPDDDDRVRRRSLLSPAGRGLAGAPGRRLRGSRAQERGRAGPAQRHLHLSGPAGVPRPDGSVPPEGEPPPGIEVISFVGQGMAEAETTGPTVVGVCFVQQRSGRPVGAWLSPPVSVST